VRLVDVGGILLIVLYAALIVLSATGVWALIVVVSTARSTRRLVEDLGERLPPLIEKAGATLDSLDAEMARVDEIVAQLEEVSDRVTFTTRAASEMVNAPVAAVVGLGDRARRFFSVLLGRRL
jgi:ABC-type transporter Mla subunit MlaD